MRPQDNQNDFLKFTITKRQHPAQFLRLQFPQGVARTSRKRSSFPKDIAISNDCKKMVIAYRFLNMISIVNIEKEEINNLFTDGNKLNWEQVIEGTPQTLLYQSTLQ